MIRVINGGVVYLDEIKNSAESDATEKATSRKCEGQLSSTKANSCSSYKGANRTTEMAQEDSNSCWNNLPSVILQEIFSYLSHNSRLRASQVFVIFFYFRQGRLNSDLTQWVIKLLYPVPLSIFRRFLCYTYKLLIAFVIFLLVTLCICFLFTSWTSI